jgi:hypothetical protein
MSETADIIFVSGSTAAAKEKIYDYHGTAIERLSTNELFVAIKTVGQGNIMMP